jgi:3'-5' exoribonuclease
MNKGPFAAELAPNQVITAVFLVKNKEIRQKQSGDPFLSLSLGDRTGDVDAKMWDNVAEVVDLFEVDDFVKVKGETLLYNRRLQMKVHSVARVDERDVDLGDFLPVSTRNPDEMFAELMQAVAGMKDPWLRKLLETIFADPEVAAAYRRAPAAKGIHHAWLGGLLEHVLSLIGLARMMARHYSYINEDLLLTGVVLHDIGKIQELNFERSFSYSNDGQLLGHISLGVRLVGEKIAALPGFPPRLRNLVEHMILSHHGTLEFGSPKVPVFAEALLLHHLDNLDSKMETLRAAVAKERAAGSEWTAWVPALERAVLDRSRYLEGPAPQAPPAPAPRSASRPAAPAQQGLLGDILTGALKKN